MQPLDISNPAFDDYAPDDDYDLEEARQEIAESAAWVELGGAQALKLTVLELETGIAYLYERRSRGAYVSAACLVAVVEDAGELTAKMLATYTHCVAPLGDEPDEDNPYATDGAAALEHAKALSLDNRTKVYEVWPLDTGERTLVYDGTVYERTFR